jgi:hypothetical protein
MLIVYDNRTYITTYTRTLLGVPRHCIFPVFHKLLIFTAFRPNVTKELFFTARMRFLQLAEFALSVLMGIG